MEKLFVLLCIAALSHRVYSQEKWIWSSSRDSKAALAREDGKGRYGVFEPDIPDEPYNPPVRPPPSNLPPLIRPSSRPPPSPNNNGPYLFPSTNNFNNINNNPPYRPDNNFNNNNPYNINNNNNNNRRPYPPQPSSSFPGRPPVSPARPPLIDPSIRPPPLPQVPPKRPSEYPDNKDPTDFDKCKCVHSFNCKSPGILFGSCDVGRKYCCEKFVPPRPRGPNDDFRDPDVLVGPGGPVDHVIRDQANYNRQGNSYGRLPGRSPFP